ncbi:MAG: HEAT repeat domain-containing protein [Treponema sp.]|jgi:HEAT repeat protein|nr:HEAT repeat domain-containing protein [Treponema sp.]
MKKMMRLGALMMVLLAAGGIPVMGQDAGREKSVEESYRETMEMMIIREQSRADSLEMKFIALEYIESAIEKGNTGPDVLGALEYLALEGILNTIRENNRITNNYPEVRRRAVQYLGNVGTPEAKSLLIRLIRTDKEPMILQEAVKALGKIGSNDNNETVNAITGIIDRKYHLNQPDNLLAFSALDAYDKIAKTNGGLNDPLAVQTIISIVEGNYSPTVRNRAKQVLKNLREYSSAGNSR